jgi:hypothetical protein
MAFDFELTQEGQAAHSADRYLNGPYEDTDVDARVDLSKVSKTPISDVADMNVATTSQPWGDVKTYAGGNIVSYTGEGARTDVEAIVATAIAADALFETGPGYTSPVVDTSSAYLDPLYLIEASKLTGEKYY